MTTFEKNIRFIITENEGGYVNDKDDAGGATKYGISLRFLKNNDIDIDNDGVVNKRDIVDLELDDAILIYKIHFYNDLYDNLNDRLLAYRLLDNSILMGKVKVIKLLQEAINEITGKETLVCDGIFGIRTLSEANKHYNTYEFFADKLKLELIRISEIRNNKKYLKGWLNRLKRCPSWLQIY